MNKVIGITGAAGTIGRTIQDGLDKNYRFLLFDKLAPRIDEKFPYYQCDLAEPDTIQDEFSSLDALVHLAADIQPTSQWESIKRNNIDMTRIIFEKAVKSGVKKIVLASTNHTQNGDLMIKNAGFETLDIFSFDNRIPIVF